MADHLSRVIYKNIPKIVHDVAAEVAADVAHTSTSGVHHKDVGAG